VADADHQAATVQAAPTRQCGACTMCCKLIEVTELEKPQNVWCAHCTPGKGCGNYAARPADCRTFDCGWLVDISLGDNWRPDRAKFVITEEPGTGRMFIVCDTAFPGAWRREPFYAKIKSLLAADGMERQQVVITTGRKLTLLVRNGEFDLGEWTKGDQISITYDKSGRAIRAAVARASQGNVETKAVGA
jgi:hypothetical protein